MLRQQAVWTDFSLLFGSTWLLKLLLCGTRGCSQFWASHFLPILFPSLLWPSGNSEPDLQPAFSNLVWSVFLFYPLHPDFTLLCP